MMARRRLNVERLITERIPHADAARAYDLLASDRGKLGVVFQYPSIAPPLERIVTRNGSATSIPSATAKRPESAGKTVAGIVGAGNFTRQMLLPSLQKTEAVLASIASAGGVTAAHCARKFNVAASTTDWHTMLADDRINTIFIATRPGSHAPMVVEALDAGKHVFVEKPLAIDDAGLDAVRQAVIKAPGRHLTVGFNRRFSPHARKMRELLASRSTPLSANILVNAGRIPPDHWIHDKTVGGGRMINEGCHWIDLLRFLVGSPIVEVKATMVGDAPGVGVRDDQIAAVFSFADGSIGTVHYFSSGHRGFPKERVEVFCEERVLELDNFRVLRGYGYPSFRKLKLFRQDKGHATEFESVVDRINRGAEPLMKFDEMENVTLASFAAVTSARDSRTISLP
jgi:predicted dehydrogenase